MKIKIRKRQIYRIGYTIINIIITIILPINTYLNFKNLIRSFNCPDCPESIVNQINLGGTESLYDILIYVFVIVGVIVTLCSYFINSFRKYSMQRSVLVCVISSVYLINITFTSQMSKILIRIANVQLIVNYFGVFILLIIISSLYVLRSLFDIIDFKINKSKYDKILRREKAVQFKQKQKKEKVKEELVECQKCEYMCRPVWKKCPICETKL